MRQFALCAVAPFVLSLAGCVKDIPLATTDAYDVVTLEEMPAPTNADAFTGVRSYAIGPYDRLTINVWGVEGMDDREVQADAAGAISFPLAGTVMAAGLTPLELQDRLRERLQAAYIRDPQVTVNLLEVMSQMVTVEGEVGKPGIYPVLGEMTLLKSIAKAEGLEEFARKDVIVFRDVAGRKYAALYDIEGIRAGNYPDPTVYGGDIVVVGESRRKRRFETILDSAPLFLSPLVLLIR